MCVGITFNARDRLTSLLRNQRNQAKTEAWSDPVPAYFHSPFLSPFSKHIITHNHSHLRYHNLVRPIETNWPTCNHTALITLTASKKNYAKYADGSCGKEVRGEGVVIIPLRSLLQKFSYNSRRIPARRFGSCDFPDDFVFFGLRVMVSKQTTRPPFRPYSSLLKNFCKTSLPYLHEDLRWTTNLVVFLHDRRFDNSYQTICLFTCWCANSGFNTLEAHHWKPSCKCLAFTISSGFLSAFSNNHIWIWAQQYQTALFFTLYMYADLLILEVCWNY